MTHGTAPAAAERVPAPDRGRSGLRPLLAVAAFFILVQAWSLSGPVLLGDEGLYFFSAHRMVRSGDWLTPKGELFQIRVHKPPLYTWLTALAFKLGGPRLASQRAVSLLAALGTAYLVYLLGLLLFESALPAVLAGIMFLGFTEVFLTCHQGRPDALLVFFITAANYALARVLLDSRRLLAWASFAYFLAALAFLTKGPYGLLHTILPALAAALILPPARKRVRYLLHPLGWLIFLVTAGSWYAALMAVHGPGIRSLVMADLARHSPGGDLAAAFLRNAGRYLADMLTKTLPWWPLLVPGFFAGRTPAGEGPPRRRLVLLFLWAWVGAVVLTVFFNPSTAGRYLLPLYPALALLGAGWLAGEVGRPGRVRDKGLALAVLSAVFTASLIPLLIGHFRYGAEISDPAVYLLPTSVLTLLLILLLWFFRRRSQLLAWAACLACLSILVNGAYDRNYNLPGNRGAVVEMSTRFLAPLDPDKVRVLCLELCQADYIPILDQGGKRPLVRYVFGDPGGVVWDRLAFPDKDRETLVVTMARPWAELDPEFRGRFEPVEEVSHTSLARGKGIFLKLETRKCLLLRLKPGEENSFSTVLKR